MRTAAHPRASRPERVWLRKPRLRRLSPGRAAAWLLLAIAILATILPLVWMLRSSLILNRDLFSDKAPILPDHPTLLNFKRVLGLASATEAKSAGQSGDGLNFVAFLRNSLIFTTAVVAGQVAFSTMAGYALARLRFRARHWLFVAFVSGLLVPPIFTIIPNFVLVRQLGLLNTFPGLIAPYVLMSPFAVFFMRQYFLNVPRDIEEAARIDGLGTLGIFFRIVLPMSKPPIITLAVIAAVFSWNDFLWPLLVGQDSSVRVLTVGLSVFQAQQPNTQPDWSGLMAASVLTIIPVFLLLLLLGRRMVGSIQLTGFK